MNRTPINICKETCVLPYFWNVAILPILSEMYFSKNLHTYKGGYRWLPIGWHRILRLCQKTFTLVPDIPGFSWDLLWVPCHDVVLLVNPIGRILVRWKVVEIVSRFWVYNLISRFWVQIIDIISRFWVYNLISRFWVYVQPLPPYIQHMYSRLQIISRFCAPPYLQSAVHMKRDLYTNKKETCAWE